MQVASETLKLHSEAKDEGFVQCLSSPAPAVGLDRLRDYAQTQVRQDGPSVHLARRRVRWTTR